MMNRSMMQTNQDAPDDFRRLLLAQLTYCRDMLDDYIKLEGRGYGEGQMPHEWGSIDTVDYMMAALDLSSAFLNDGVLGDPARFLATLASKEEDNDPDDPMTHLEMNYACDGVAPDVYSFVHPEEVNPDA